MPHFYRFRTLFSANYGASAVLYHLLDVPLDVVVRVAQAEIAEIVDLMGAVRAMKIASFHRIVAKIRLPVPYVLVFQVFRILLSLSNKYELVFDQNKQSSVLKKTFW